MFGCWLRSFFISVREQILLINIDSIWYETLAKVRRVFHWLKFLKIVDIIIEAEDSFVWKFGMAVQIVAFKCLNI